MDNGLPLHKQEGYAERLAEQDDLLRKAFREDAILEGRRLNREAYIDGKREAEAMDRNREP